MTRRLHIDLHGHQNGIGLAMMQLDKKRNKYCSSRIRRELYDQCSRGGNVDFLHVDMYSICSNLQPLIRKIKLKLYIIST